MPSEYPIFTTFEEAIRQKNDGKYVYEFVSEKEYPVPG